MRRRLLSGLLSLAIVASAVATAEAQTVCSSPADQETFDVEALKSQLIVLATSCHSDEPYNAFVRKYQTELGQTERNFDAYFKRAYGRRAQAEHDSYITSLANAQFGMGLKQGQDFCPRNAAVFQEVMALRSPSDLTSYAAGKDLIPANLGACAAPIPATAAGHVRGHTVSHKKG
jgi:hypothetical protein